MLNEGSALWLRGWIAHSGASTPKKIVLDSHLRAGAARCCCCGGRWLPFTTCTTPWQSPATAPAVKYSEPIIPIRGSIDQRAIVHVVVPWHGWLERGAQRRLRAVCGGRVGLAAICAAATFGARRCGAVCTCLQRTSLE
jgi:hypothetical protein